MSCESQSSELRTKLAILCVSSGRGLVNRLGGGRQGTFNTCMCFYIYFSICVIGANQIRKRFYVVKPSSLLK